MKPWWKRWPGRLEYELEALEAAGFLVTNEVRSEGALRLSVEAPAEATGSERVTLEVSFPDTYPRTAPQVAAPALDLPHHQHPFGHTLCLIGRESRYWDSTSTLADLLSTQLRQAIAAGSGVPGDHNEIDQGEPFASYYTYTEGIEARIETEGTTAQPGERGDLTLRVGGFAPPVPAGRRLDLLVERLDSSDLKYIASEPLRDLASEAAEVTGRWVVLNDPVREDQGEAIWDAAAAIDTRQPTAWNVAGGQGLAFRLVGFPDEISATERGTGWVMVIRQAGSTQTKKTRSRDPRKREQTVRGPAQYHLARVNCVGRSDLRARTPRTSGLADRSALVIGCGAIGSVFVEQLARAGLGSVYLIDKDHLEPGNLARHASNLAHTGAPKALAVAMLAKSVNPFIDPQAGMFTVGQPGEVEGKSVLAVLEDAAREFDLVVDASAEVGIQEVSADLARQAGRPWLGLAASEGAAGGWVALVPTGVDWCHACFQWFRADGTIPFPVAVDEGVIQPVGCAEPTFAGTGFDLAEVSLHAARVATAHLLRDEPDGYPDDEFDAYNLTLRNEDGSRALPRWDGYAMKRHPNCSGH